MVPVVEVGDDRASDIVVVGDGEGVRWPSARRRPSAELEGIRRLVHVWRRHGEELDGEITRRGERPGDGQGAIALRPQVEGSDDGPEHAATSRLGVPNHCRGPPVAAVRDLRPFRVAARDRTFGSVGTSGDGRR